MSNETTKVLTGLRTHNGSLFINFFDPAAGDNGSDMTTYCKPIANFIDNERSEFLQFFSLEDDAGQTTVWYPGYGEHPVDDWAHNTMQGNNFIQLSIAEAWVDEDGIGRVKATIKHGKAPTEEVFKLLEWGTARAVIKVEAKPVRRSFGYTARTKKADAA